MFIKVTFVDKSEVDAMLFNIDDIAFATKDDKTYVVSKETGELVEIEESFSDLEAKLVL